MVGAIMNYKDVIENANIAKKSLSNASEETKIEALKAMSKALKDNVPKILEANKLDLDNASLLMPVMRKRLALTEEKIIAIANDVISVSNLDSVCNKVLETINRPNGLVIKKVAVPFGVILAIFESRPNVCVDIASLCIKTSNICVLRGGKEAINTNTCLVSIIREAIAPFIDENSVSLITETDRAIVNDLITMKDKIDLVVPRGGKGLIDNIVNNSLVPVIETGAGTCHIYVDKNASLDMAVNITLNGKLSNPAVCNALECILVHENVYKEYFDLLKSQKFDKIVNVHGCDITKEHFNCDSVSSYYKEFDDLEVNIKVVKSLDEAISHINTYGTKHSEVVVTNDEAVAQRFLSEVDAACVYWNASSRFSDGGCFGFGAELGISTGKMHARGPMGLKEMMTYKYEIFGNGQIRK